MDLIYGGFGRMMSSAETMAIPPLAVNPATTLFAAMTVDDVIFAALANDSLYGGAERTSKMFGGKAASGSGYGSGSVAGATPFLRSRRKVVRHRLWWCSLERSSSGGSGGSGGSQNPPYGVCERTRQ